VGENQIERYYILSIKSALNPLKGTYLNTNPYQTPSGGRGRKNMQDVELCYFNFSLKKATVRLHASFAACSL